MPFKGTKIGISTKKPGKHGTVTALRKDNREPSIQNSVLTKALQDSIGGDSRTLMFVNFLLLPTTR